MERLEIRRRNQAIRHKKSFIVIGCEGKNKTETIYLKNYSSRKCIIKFSTGNHTDPVGMANDLLEYIKNEDINKEYGDKIYLLLDTDVGQNKQKEINNAKDICNSNGIELITSTPTFELWYILHYGYTTKKYQSSKEVKKEMKQKIKGYSENKDIFDIINQNRDNAIKNAKQLASYQLENGQVLDNEDCNPYTGVYKVVEELIKRDISEEIR